ncbi:intermembrane transport protein PqiB [Aestuariibacter salexigens]|uniref:intermembrane transport protein PqiB n=1 Tax=Aestuariibacter salexigens TaxID=226010 RepID=UPI00041540D1|nr:intermembrane transport protein PqiB [Aestuariibacter salexigens]
MSEQITPGDELPMADIQPVRSISRVWLIPLVALLIGLWIVYYQWSNQGPLITIEFSSATGIEVDKTSIKARDFDVGVVKAIELKPDLSGVIVTARIDPSAAHLLTENTQFWVIAPRVSITGVSGLSTLLSGRYIAMEPSEEGQEQYEFIALERPPVTPPGTPGLHVTLNSDDEFAFKEGDPIVYKGLKVGEFEDIYFNVEERIVYYNAFIEAPYHKLITENTRFWNTSGVRFELSASGVNIETGSLETLLTNGVTFGIPEGMASGQQITKRAFFDIYRDYESASNARFNLAAEFILLIDETVRGLTVGAPVEYRGIEIGEVAQINPPISIPGSILDEEYSIPVLIKIYPGRVQQQDNEQGVEFVREQIMHWVNNDLRARLRIGNLITGGLYVELQHIADTPDVELVKLAEYDVIPTLSDEFAQITQKMESLLDKLNNMPLEDVLADLQEVMANVSSSAASVRQTSQAFESTLSGINSQQLNGNLNKTLQQMQTLLAGYSDGSPTNLEINDTLSAIQTMLNDLQPILLQLNHTPNSLIFTGDTQHAVFPKRSTSASNGDNND